MKSFLLMGQSNMAGRGDFGEVPEIVNPKCFMLRNGRWQPMSEPINPDRPIFGYYHSGIGLSASFADEYAKYFGEEIGLIPCADGGTKIEQWQPGELLYDSAVSQAKLARRTSEIAGILWHQGENDSINQEDAELYHDRFINMISSLTKDLDLPENIPVIIGELGDFVGDCNGGECKYFKEINSVLKILSTELPCSGFVRADGLTCKEDGIHFNSKSCREFGKRYFKEYLRITDCMEILSEKRCKIGEGPVWNTFDNKLYHVNAAGPNEICCIDLESKETTVRKLDFGVAALGFSKEGEMLISCQDGAFILNDDGTRKPLYDSSKYEIKYGNDAKVGPDGRFYIGTQSSKRKGVGDAIDGKLYSIDKDGNVNVLLDGLRLSNGFDWSMDEKRFYHTDSDTKIIKEYNFNKETGEISFTGRLVEVPGVDGITIDRNDFLYAACWGRGHIVVIDTADLQVKRYIDVPARIPASCGFAGKELDRLIVVTATLGSNLETDKNAGYTFLYDAKTKGRKPYLFG